MNIDAYSILIFLSVLVVLSYLFNFLAAKLRIPSVLLLIGSGVGLRYAGTYFSFELPPTATLLEILGIIGLIFIVLEASLDLSIQREKLPLIARALASAALLFAVTAGLIALVFVEYFNAPFRQALVHAIPLSVISSAIAIPSVRDLTEIKREFIIYESTFSDIIGIIAFNYVAIETLSGTSALIGLSGDLILIICISIISTVALIFLLNHSTTNVRFFLTLAILILIYSLAKFLHLPSLVLVLCFGLVLANLGSFNFPFVRRLISIERVSEVAKELKLITSETAFIIRTFFFLLFGYSINVHLLLSAELLSLGAGIIVLSVLTRFIFLKYLLKSNAGLLALIAPRGLITILLFYSIPEKDRLESLSEGILFVVILFTGIVMMIGLMLNQRSPVEKIEDVV